MDDDVRWVFFCRRLATLNTRSAVSRTHNATLIMQTVTRQQHALQAQHRIDMLLANVEQVQLRTHAQLGEPLGVSRGGVSPVRSERSARTR